MAKEFVVELHIFDEHCEGPNTACIAVGQRLAERIAEMKVAVARHNLAYAATFDCHPEYGTVDNQGMFEEDKSFSVDAVTLEVSKDQFVWSGYLKGSGTSFRTEPISIRELEELLPKR